MPPNATLARSVVRILVAVLSVQPTSGPPRQAVTDTAGNNRPFAVGSVAVAYCGLLCLLLTERCFRAKSHVPIGHTGAVCLTLEVGIACIDLQTVSYLQLERCATSRAMPQAGWSAAMEIGI